jgi:16S rRNA (adenine1518-N6/adenine1519-N6)-dimethyltransferase
MNSHPPAADRSCSSQSFATITNMSSDPAPKKSLGQHWLNDLTALEAMCADVHAGDTVLEIGPGLGTLTKLLVARAEQVIAVELDDTLVADLPKNVPAHNLQIVHQDILQFDFSALPPDYKIVANIPYYLTSHLIRVMSETPNPASTASLLVQKEVAERLAAAPGSMSLLSVLAQFYWEVGLAEVVPAELFDPPPKVDSQIVVFIRRPKPLFPDAKSADFFRLVRSGFGQRRKTLLNSLSGGLHLDRAAVQTLCEAAGIDPGARAQTLSLDDWHKLYLAHNT